MERSQALRRPLHTLALVTTLGVGGAIVYSCASAAPSVQHPSRPPTKLLAVAPPSTLANSAEPASPFSLEGFRPLLADARYEAVRLRLEAGAHGAAADLLQDSLRHSPPPVGELPRHQFLLARLLEQAGRAAQARDLYVAVSALGSALAPYAELGAGRMELRLGAAARALLHVGRTGEDLPEASGRRRLLAEAALKSGAREIALREYRVLLKQAQGTRDRAVATAELLAALVGDGPRRVDLQRAELEEALRLARSLAALSEDGSRIAEQAKLEQERLLALFPEGEHAKFAAPSAAERLERLRVLVDARRFEPAQALLQEFPVLLASAGEAEACEIEFLRAKVAVARKRGAVAEQLYSALAHSSCAGDVRVRALYAAGRAAQQEQQHALAIKHFAELERVFATQTLADDARLYSALSSLELGDEARFTEALATMPDDYPEGDMVAEGCFRLALRRMERQDFQSAERPLARALARLPANEASRGGDFAGRERYFLARVLIETGERERGLQAYERLIGDLPLGYYVRAAFSALSDAEPARAMRAIEQAAAAAEREPPSLTRSPQQPLAPGFRRALELSTVGELPAVQGELALLSAESAAPELLFNAAVLYARTGAVKLSSDAARLVFGMVPPRWPAAEWLPVWKLAYPRPYAELVGVQARKNALDPSLIYAVMREESGFDPGAESPADAYGLMQLIAPTAKQMAKPLGLPHDRASLLRPSVNIALGSRVLAKYREKFPDDPLLAIAAYNAGPGAARRWQKARPGSSFDLWVELIPYLETRRYIKRVLGSAAVYAVVYQEGEREAALALPQKLGF